MPLDPFIQAYALAFRAQTQDWITLNVRVLAAQYSARPLKLSVAMLRHEKALEAHLDAVGRERGQTKRWLLHARAQLYAAMLNEPALLPVYEKAYPEGEPLLHSEFLSQIERNNASIKKSHDKQLYRKLKAERVEIVEAVGAQEVITKHARLEFERAKRAYHTARQAHEDNLLARRLANIKAVAAPTLIRARQEANAAHTLARRANAKAQLDLAVLKQRKYRVQQKLARLRPRII